MLFILTVYTRISAAISKQPCGAYLNTDFFFCWLVNMEKAALLAGRIVTKFIKIQTVSELPKN